MTGSPIDHYCKHIAPWLTDNAERSTDLYGEGAARPARKPPGTEEHVKALTYSLDGALTALRRQDRDIAKLKCADRDVLDEAIAAALGPVKVRLAVLEQGPGKVEREEDQRTIGWVAVLSGGALGVAVLALTLSLWTWWITPTVVTVPLAIMVEGRP